LADILPLEGKQPPRGPNREPPPIPGADIDKCWLIVVLTLFLSLGTVYSLVTPIFEASDERWHYPVIQYIADERILPGQDPAIQTLWRQEGSQPPLYYVLAAGVTMIVDTSDFAAVHRPNLHAVVGLPLEIGNKNMMIHTDRERWPWQGTTLAVHLIRLLSLGMGAVTVWLTWRIAHRLWPDERAVLLLAAALTAFNPMFLFISASVNNDNLAAPLAAAAILVLLRAIQRPEGQTLRDGVWLGILLGLGALTKLSALALVPLTALALTWSAAHRRTWRTWLINGMLIVGLMSVIAGWWYCRNWVLYGDPTGLDQMLQITGRRHEVLTLGQLQAEFEGFRLSYWALFGAFNILMDRWLYVVLDVIACLGLAGIIVAGVSLLRDRYRRTSRADSRSATLSPVVFILLTGWVVLVLVSLIRWTAQTYASQGRLMFVAIAGISSLLAAGLLTLMPSPRQGPLHNGRKIIAGAVTGGLFLLAAIIPLQYIVPAYARLPLLTEHSLPAHVQRVDWDISGQMRLLGYSLAKTTVRPAEKLPVMVYWQAIAPMTVDYSVFVHLLGQERAVVGQVNTYPGLGAWPTTLLRPGDVVADTYYVPVAADAAAPSLLRVHVGLYRYDEPGRPALDAVDANGDPGGPWLTTVKMVPWDWPQVQPSTELLVRLGKSISLTGFDLSQPVVGSPHDLTLYWQATGKPAADYTAFIQLWDEHGQVAGFDGPPVAGYYPTSWWDTGERIIDHHFLDLNNLPAGRYRILVGMYRLDTGTRLPAADANGPLPDNAITLTEIAIQ
jgi:hypothetical protein